MQVSDFSFELPERLIAQAPPAVRGASRMLRMRRADGALADGYFTDLPACLQEGDLLVLNDSRVLPGRLYATRAGLRTQQGSPEPSGRVEVLLTGELGGGQWTALVKPGRKVPPGERLLFADRQGAVALTAEVIAAGERGQRTLLFADDPEFFPKLDRIGHIPLPPYIHRDAAAEDRPDDRERYQTVYAAERGSAAAPTAGLHFTPEILAAVRARGVEVATVTLHVGLGTFQPVRADRVEDIQLHAERYTLPAATASAVNAALRQGRRIVAAGTTTVRTLEHCAASCLEPGQLAPGHLEPARLEPAYLEPAYLEPAYLKPESGQTSIFIAPGFRFRVVSGLLTNFHLPQSTLLMLVSAFAGREPVLAAYRHAVTGDYRFFSYGDCMLIL